MQAMPQARRKSQAHVGYCIHCSMHMQTNATWHSTQASCAKLFCSCHKSLVISDRAQQLHHVRLAARSLSCS